jgi:hypothetical protein
MKRNMSFLPLKPAKYRVDDWGDSMNPCLDRSANVSKSAKYRVDDWGNLESSRRFGLLPGSLLCI